MLKITVSFFLLLLLSANAYAAHPLITDDTDTQGRGKFQIEINTGFAADNRNGGTEKEQSTDANTALSFGVADNIDLIAALPQKWLLISVNGSTAQDERGIGDMTIEMKWRFLEDETTGLRLALKPGFSLPTGNAEKGLGSGARSESLTLMATREGRLGALHCNLGYSRNETDDDNTRNNIWHASVATEINVMGDLRAVLNTGIETNEEKGSATHPAFLLGGVIYAVSENLDLDLGLKCALNKAETDRTFLVGLASRF
ncbi:transporter [Chlorobium sp. BLA1]|uniref:transporter n=1 Tax=Candidatus Chlorobium masyuteum TaxID=2716876 RepID=UPI001422A199|nr:transporter [Candidatus Chlorobium masyuteum]NHQ59290.1 transporter [Candidatus Chlorobium masyuteum]NTU45065.1 transporter [Chlorobiaceae bacterium]